MTHTFAILEVPGTAFAAIKALLAGAGYDHAFTRDGEDEVIDMHGIALKAKSQSAAADITVSSLVSSRTGQGRIEFQVNGEIVQMDLDKGREVVRLLQGAIEAAISDELISRFLVERLRFSPTDAIAALVDFREMRQGSRDRVVPN